MMKVSTVDAMSTGMEISNLRITNTNMVELTSESRERVPGVVTPGTPRFAGLDSSLARVS